MEKNYWLDRRDDAVAEMMEAYRSSLEEDYISKLRSIQSEYNAKEAALKADFESRINDLYEKFSQELEAAENTASKGYAEAWEVIQNLQKQLGEAKNSRCPDCGYRPGERGDCGNFAGIPPTEANWEVDL